MGFVKPGAGLAIIVAAGALALSPDSPLREPEAEQGAPSISYRVLDTGRETGCEMTLAGPAAGDRLPLLFTDACAAEGALADIRYWTDLADGTVELTDATGAVSMRLAESDGAAFEAFGGGIPLITLVDARD